MGTSMTAAMECGDSRRDGLDTGHGEWRVATMTLVAASAARARGSSGCGREEPLRGGLGDGHNQLSHGGQ